MDIHQQPKAHPQRTIQFEIMSPYLFPTWKRTVPFTSFHFLESFAYLLCSIDCFIKDGVFTKWKYNSLT